MNRKMKTMMGVIISATVLSSFSAVSAAAPCPPAAVVRTISYKVCSGDSLWKIASAFKIGINDIIKMNPQYKNPSMICPGDVVYIVPRQPSAPSVPTPPAPTLTVTSTNLSVSAYETQVANLVNEIRAQNGLGKLTMNAELSNAARYKSQDMKDKNYFSHTSPTYGSPFDMMKSFGISYRSAGENIAHGYSTPQAVVDAWMNSPGHKANILNPSYTQIGIGHTPQGNYWTQWFIG